MEKIQKIIAYSFIILCTLLVPLAFHDGYFDITWAKATVYQIGLVILMVGLSVSFPKGRITRIELLLMLFAGLSVFSSFLSKDFITSFLRNKGWFVGSFVIVTGTLFSIFIGRVKLNNKCIIEFIGLVNIFFFILSILRWCEQILGPEITGRSKNNVYGRRKKQGTSIV